MGLVRRSDHDLDRSTVHELSLGDRSKLGSEVVAVCAGTGTPRLLGLSEAAHFEAGHLCVLPLGLEDLGGRALSYNYTPRPEIHPDGRGGAMDVYAYPRRSTLVLGGTRLRGVLPPRGPEQVDAYEGRQLTVTDSRGRPQAVPAPILELNEILLRQLFGRGLGGAPIRCAIGRRYRGRSAEGEVIERSEIRHGRRIVACYGLGGAGVTLSWGLAARVLARVADEIGPPLSTASGGADLAERLLARVRRSPAAECLAGGSGPAGRGRAKARLPADQP